jgi:hypothetical protein
LGGSQCAQGPGWGQHNISAKVGRVFGREMKVDGATVGRDEVGRRVVGPPTCSYPACGGGVGWVGGWVGGLGGRVG